MSIHGRSFVVTGGTGALGAAVVERLLAGGAEVHVPWILERELRGFAHASKVRTEQVDLTSEAQVSTYYASIDRLWGSIHVAGGFAMSPIVETSAAEFERLWRLNTLTCFLCCREAVAAMRRAAAAAHAARGASAEVGGAKLRGGRIVNVAARPALLPAAGMLAYSASKAGVLSITESLAAETTAEGILVNAVVPSIMDTPANRAAMPAADHAAWPKVAEVAEAMCWLASPANALTSGAALPVFGRA